MATGVADLTTSTFDALRRERRLLGRLAPRIVETQVAVTRIAAPTGHEERRAVWVADRFEEIGLRARIDGAGNVVARAGSAGEAPVVVCAHLDTVFPESGAPVDIHRAGSRIVGPGICDNGRGLAVMLAIARVMRRCPPLHRAVEFVATTGEEGVGDLRGAKHYFADAARPFAVVALDGAGDDHIVNTALGSRRYRVTYRGPGGHSWAAHGTVNPVHAVARAAAHLAALGAPAQPLVSERATAPVRAAQPGHAVSTVSRIGGGVAINAIPEEAWFELDVRSVSDDALQRRERDLGRIVESIAAEENQRRAPGTAALTFSLERIGDRPGGETEADRALVVAAMAATRLVGRVPELATASTDANAAIAVGVPAIAIGGGGRGGEAHSSREWFDASESSAGVERALTIVATMARLAAD